MDRGIQRLEEMIRVSAFRHKVLASNIANVDTPGYKAKDVPFRDEMKNQALEMAKTSPQHLRGNRNSREAGGIVAVERSVWGDGNNVALDVELANMTENALLYEAGIRLLSKKFMMYKNAIKGR